MGAILADRGEVAAGLTDLLELAYTVLVDPGVGYARCALQGFYTKVAIKLQLDVALPEEVVRIPSGVEVVTSAEVFDQIDFVLESYKDLADQAQQRDTPSRKDAPRQLPVQSGQP